MRLIFWEVFDCIGQDFPKSWDALYATLANDPTSVASERIVQTSVDRWRNHSEAAWSLWPKVLIGEKSQRDLRGFCPYGYCAALYLRLRNEQSQELIDEFGACASWQEAWWPWNFVGETRWSRFLSPSELLHIHSGHKEQWLASLPGKPAPGSTSAVGSSWQPPLLWARQDRRLLDGACSKAVQEKSVDGFLPEYGPELRGALSKIPKLSTVPYSGFALPQKSDPSVRIAAFGVHFTTLLEPISALRFILPKALRMAAVFYGSSHPPPEPIVQEVCPENNPSSGLVCYLSTSPGNDFWQKLVDRKSMADAAQHLSGVLVMEQFIKTADFLICGGGQSPTLCFILRMVTGKPMLFTLQAPLSFRMPADEDQRALLVALFREMAPTTLACTCSVFLQRQVFVQTGTLLPVVRNHNWYAGLVPGRWGDDEGEETPHEIMFWQNHVALKADCSMVVWRFIKQVVQDDFPYNIVFKNVRNLPGARAGRKVYALRNQESQMLSFGAMRRKYLGAVLFPHDLGMFSFDDLYALGVPLFLPEDELIMQIAFTQLTSTRNYPWYLLREEHAKLKFGRGDVDASPPWEPGWKGAEVMTSQGRATWLGHDALGVDRLLESMQVSNFKLYPHIRRFRSLTSLLQLLGCLTKDDLLATGEAMRRSSEDSWKVTAEYYHRVVGNLLGIELPA